jgi:hypothetical protein
MMKKKRKIRVIIIGLCALGFVVFLVVNMFSEIDKGLAEHLPSTYTLRAEDSNLILNRYRGKLKVDEVYHSSVRGPVSFISFDKGYKLIIYKIDLAIDSSLKTIFNTEIKSMDRSMGYSYSIMENNIFFRFEHKAGPTRPVSKIYLTLTGDSLQSVVKNDSVISYHLLCDNFSIRYAENDPIDIFVVGKEKMLATTTVIPMDLLFLKRDGAIYLLIMTPNNPKSTIAPDLLYNVVMGI